MTETGTSSDRKVSANIRHSMLTSSVDEKYVRTPVPRNRGKIQDGLVEHAIGIGLGNDDVLEKYAVEDAREASQGVLGHGFRLLFAQFLYSIHIAVATQADNTQPCRNPTLSINPSRMSALWVAMKSWEFPDSFSAHNSGLK